MATWHVRPAFHRAVKIALLAFAAVGWAAALARAEPEVPAVATADENFTGRERHEYMGRTIAPTMHFSGAGWLTRPTREEEEDPLKLLSSLKVKPGQVVCDFGCGNGYHSLQLAKRVGAAGQVYAIDIQPEMLEMLEERAGPRGLENIKPLLATGEGSGLPAGSFDLVLMVDVYHELSDPEAILAEIRASLKPEGRLVLVEFREEDETVPILPLHKMSQVQVVKELEANSFHLAGQYNRLPWQHVLHFVRSDSPIEKAELKPWRPVR
ncbi:putative methyltransferase [Lacipirellula parvula]|uniref:Putative methyltransferase n=1 Tax=Lacipirellula parvula TaxID=2650471 RepID=A0A5K7X566_9BACT|nr:putative methyltransferase [Lacipirellula parvula]